MNLYYDARFYCHLLLSGDGPEERWIFDRFQKRLAKYIFSDLLTREYNGKFPAIYTNTMAYMPHAAIALYRLRLHSSGRRI